MTSRQGSKWPPWAGLSNGIMLESIGDLGESLRSPVLKHPHLFVIRQCLGRMVLVCAHTHVCGRLTYRSVGLEQGYRMTPTLTLSVTSARAQGRLFSNTHMFWWGQGHDLKVTSWPHKVMMTSSRVNLTRAEFYSAHFDTLQKFFIVL